MPAFTYVASIIVAEVFWAAGLYALGSAGVAFVTSAIAFGLAYGTARLLGLTGGSGGTAQDPGVRIQLPPATNNKVPIIYGKAFQKGVITDARISNDNKTMTYVMVLSEKTQTGTFTVGNIYWNDNLLQFKSDSSSHIVASSIDQDGKGETSTAFDGLIRIRVYAGGTGSGNQIFPANNATSALTFLGESDTNYLMSDLVFAVIQIDYSSEKGITGLAQMTFEINNSLNNPGLIWYDYLTSNRYGAGIPADQINTSTSVSSANTLSLYSISNQIPANQFESDGTTPSTQVRYQINGVLSTGETVKNNIEKICQSSVAWTTFDYSEGQWKILPNRAATAGELDNAIIFNDDNIVGDIGISATNLEDLYNNLEVEFASRLIKDQSDYYRDAIASGVRNALEPDNTLNMRLDLVNNGIHAARIGLIELKQSRFDLIATFTADYSALQLEAGDVIKLTNATYGFENKLFRITKLREVEGEDGALNVEVTAIQYDASVYDDDTIDDFAPNQGSGIPAFGSTFTLPAPSAPVVSDDNETANIPNFTLSSTIASGSQPVNSIEWFYSDNASTGFLFLASEIPAGGTYAAGETVQEIIRDLRGGTWYFKARTTAGSLSSDLSAASSAFTWNPQPAGASNGTINTSTYSSEVFINATNSGVKTIVLTTGTNDYKPLSADSDFTYDPATNRAYLGPHQVSTVTQAIYVEYMSTNTTALVATTASQAVTFTELLTPSGITNGLNTTTLVSPSTGTYIVSWRAQFSNADNNVTQRARMWLKENGTDLPRSATTISIPGAHGGDDGFAVLTSVFMFNSNKDDIYELHWTAESTDVSIETVPASVTDPVYPISPSVNLTAYKMVGAP